MSADACKICGPAPRFHALPKLYIRIFLNSINSHPYENLDRGDYEKKMEKCQNINYKYKPHSHFKF